VNPQVAFATDFGAKNAVPYFVRSNGPVREARFKYYPDGTPDGGVHVLFVISGRKDGSGDDAQGQKGNIMFRIPTPVFGAGLILDGSTLNNLAGVANGKAALGIGGRQRRHGHTLRVEGTEQVAPDLRGRGLQRRAGHLQ
jgi:hypothetical protein